MVIKAVEKTVEDKERYYVILEDGQSFTLSEEDYFKLNLYEKKLIRDDELEYIKKHVFSSDAKGEAIKYISMKIRCENEVKKWLRQKGYTDEIIDIVIIELKSLGYINDNMYVQKYLYDRNKLKPKSKSLLKEELKEKGIEDDIINNELDEWKMDDYTTAENLVKRKYGKYDLKDKEILKKVYYFLRHRGFSYEVIRSIINKYNNNMEF